MQSIISIMGPTGSGKSTLVTELQELDDRVYPIQMGKELRKRHPNETFDGSGAIERMRQEKWDIWDDLILEAPKDAIVVVDGMPRASAEMEEYKYRNIVFDTIVLLDCNPSVRTFRVEERGSTVIPERIEGDYAMIYSALASYMNHIGNDHFITLHGFETDHTKPEAIAKYILSELAANPRM